MSNKTSWSEALTSAIGASACGSGDLGASLIIFLSAICWMLTAVEAPRDPVVLAVSEVFAFETFLEIPLSNPLNREPPAPLRALERLRDRPRKDFPGLEASLPLVESAILRASSSFLFYLLLNERGGERLRILL
jgi:hypothetical protein